MIMVTVRFLYMVYFFSNEAGPEGEFERGLVTALLSVAQNLATMVAIRGESSRPAADSRVKEIYRTSISSASFAYVCDILNWPRLLHQSSHYNPFTHGLTANRSRGMTLLSLTSSPRPSY